MGKYIFDQYTYLHFAAGIIVYYWGISLPAWICIHYLFEIVENTKYGMNFINKYLPIWPGGKPKADSIINIIGDNIGAIIGWLSAYLLDMLGSKYNWYQRRIND